MNWIKNHLPKTVKLWQIAVITLLLADAIRTMDNVMSWTITAAVFILLPGILFLKKFDLTGAGKLVQFCMSMCLGIFLLMASGLVLNTLQYVGLEKPLSLPFILLTVNIYTVILIYMNRSVVVHFKKNTPKTNLLFWINTLICLSLPCLAIFGAIRLNNGASNILTMILFALIALLIIWFAIIKESRSLFPLAVFSIGLSVLLSTSLRGWTAIGHDIQHEFQVFQTVYSNGVWGNVIHRGDPYNSCLSITMLPTMLQNLTGIQPDYIYKAVFQIIFATSIIFIYLIAKKFCKSYTALLACILFISFPPFITDLPYLNRQEIAFVFFGFVLLTNFYIKNKTTKVALTCIGLIGVTLSHYSSAYVTIGLLVLGWTIFQIFKRRTLTKSSYFIPLLSLPILVMSFLFTFMWNAQITTSTKGLDSTVSNTFQGLFGENGAEKAGVKYSLFSAPKINPIKSLEQFSGDNAPNVKYAPTPALQVTTLGSYIQNVVPVERLNTEIRLLISRTYQVLLVGGVVLLFYRALKRVPAEQMYLLCIAFGSLLSMVAMTVLPQLSVDYSVTRLFQQTLIITSIPMVIFARFLFKKLRLNRVMVGVFFSALFLHLSGFIPQAIGGFQDQLSLNNSGQYYNIYYEKPSELLAAEWITDLGYNGSIAADSYTKMHLPNYPFTANRVVNPIIASPNTRYLFLDESNNYTGKYATFFNGSVIEYTFKSPLTDGNLVYSNQTSKIYRK